MEVARPMGEEATGNGDDTAGNTVVGDIVDSGKVIGGAIPGVVDGGYVRSGEDVLGTES